MFNCVKWDQPYVKNVEVCLPKIICKSLLFLKLNLINTYLNTFNFSKNSS